MTTASYPGRRETTIDEREAPATMRGILEKYASENSNVPIGRLINSFVQNGQKRLDSEGNYDENANLRALETRILGETGMFSDIGRAQEYIVFAEYLKNQASTLENGESERMMHLARDIERHSTKFMDSYNELSSYSTNKKKNALERLKGVNDAIGFIAEDKGINSRYISLSHITNKMYDMLNLSDRLGIKLDKKVKKKMKETASRAGDERDYASGSRKKPSNFKKFTSFMWTNTFGLLVR